MNVEEKDNQEQNNEERLQQNIKDTANMAKDSANMAKNIATGNVKAFIEGKPVNVVN